MKELEEKHCQLILPNGVTKVKTDSYILFLKTCANDIPKILYSVKIAADLQMTVFSQGVKLKECHVRSLCSSELNMCSALNEIFNHLNSHFGVKRTDQDVLDDVIKMLRDQRFDGNTKIGFIVEQLTLIFKSQNGRRYSSSLLAMAFLLQRMSPRQLYSDGFLTLPSPDHLRCLCSALGVDMLSLSDSTIAYLKAWFQRLKEKAKLASVLMDEVYSQQTVPYVNGKFYGTENGQFTKTLLSVMLKSVAGKYRDIIVMAPVVNINADILFEVWSNVVRVVTDIGFDVAVTMTWSLIKHVVF